MCTRSFDAQVRAGACMALGQVFSSSGNSQVVQILCKLMSDQEEQVRCAAIIAQALTLQSICGVELPDAQKLEIETPVGDRQKNCLYKCDYESEEAWERAKNQQQLYRTPGVLADRYKQNYTSKVEKQLDLNQYTTQFRRDLAKSDELHLMTQRACTLALGIMNAGGLNLSF